MRKRPREKTEIARQANQMFRERRGRDAANAKAIDWSYEREGEAQAGAWCRELFACAGADARITRPDKVT